MCRRRRRRRQGVRGALGTCGSRRAAAPPPEARTADSEGHVGAWACGNGRGVEQEETEAAHAWRAPGPAEPGAEGCTSAVLVGPGHANGHGRAVTVGRSCLCTGTMYAGSPSEGEEASQAWSDLLVK